MKITIPDWLKSKNPVTAEFCEIINEALKNRPNMSLAEFAEQIDKVHKERALQRLQDAEAAQFGAIP